MIKNQMLTEGFQSSNYKGLGMYLEFIDLVHFFHIFIDYGLHLPIDCH